MTSSLKPHIQITPILYFSRQFIFPGKFIQIKQEGSESLQARVISISSLLNITTQIQSTLNPSRQNQAWISQQHTKNSTACWPTEGWDPTFRLNKFRCSPSALNSRFASSSWSGESAINSYFYGLGRYPRPPPSSGSALRAGRSAFPIHKTRICVKWGEKTWVFCSYILRQGNEGDSVNYHRGRPLQ